MRKIVLVVASLGVAFFLYSRFKSESKAPTVIEKTAERASSQESLVKEEGEEAHSLRRQKRENKEVQGKELKVVKVKKTDSSESFSTPEERKAHKLEAYAASAKLEEAAMNMDMQMERALAGVMAMDLSEKQRNALNKIKEEISGERYLKDLKEELSKQLTEDDLDELNSLYKDQIVNEVMERKSYYQTLEGQAEFSREMASFDPSTLSEERKNILMNYEKGSLEKKQAIESMSKMFRASMRLSGGDKPGLSEEQFKSFEENMAKNIEKASLAMKYNMLKGYSNDQVRELSSKFETPAFKKQQKVVVKLGARTTDKLVEIFNQAAKN